MIAAAFDALAVTVLIAAVVLGVALAVSAHRYRPAEPPPLVVTITADTTAFSSSMGAVADRLLVLRESHSALRFRLTMNHERTKARLFLAELVAATYDDLGLEAPR